MRFALFIASILVLSGCASAEPQAMSDEPAGQVTEQPEQTNEAEAPEESSEPAEEQTEPEEQEPEESEEAREDSEESESDLGAQDEPGESESPEEEAEAEEESEAEQPQETEEPAPTPTPEESFEGYTLAEVAQRGTASECWVAIDGSVYDLTDWIRSHPGGSGAILNLCGTDGSASFTSRHGGQASPSRTLESYYLAPLVG